MSLTSLRWFYCSVDKFQIWFCCFQCWIWTSKWKERLLLSVRFGLVRPSKLTFSQWYKVILPYSEPIFWSLWCKQVSRGRFVLAKSPPKLSIKDQHIGQVNFIQFEYTIHQIFLTWNTFKTIRNILLVLCLYRREFKT